MTLHAEIIPEKCTIAKIIYFMPKNSIIVDHKQNRLKNDATFTMWKRGNF